MTFMDLPAKTLRCIFDFTLPSTNTAIRPYEIPRIIEQSFRLSHICSRLREIAIHIPSLWVFIGTMLDEDILEVCLKRSASAGLYVSIDGNGLDEFLTRVSSHYERWKVLEAHFELDGRSLAKLLAMGRGREFPMLEDVTISYLLHPPDFANPNAYPGLEENIRKFGWPVFDWRAPNLTNFTGLDIFPITQVRSTHIRDIRYIRQSHGTRLQLPLSESLDLLTPLTEVCVSRASPIMLSNDVAFPKEMTLPHLRTLITDLADIDRRFVIISCTNFVALRFPSLTLLKINIREGDAGNRVIRSFFETLSEMQRLHTLSLVYSLPLALPSLFNASVLPPSLKQLIILDTFIENQADQEQDSSYLDLPPLQSIKFERCSLRDIRTGSNRFEFTPFYRLYSCIRGSTHWDSLAMFKVIRCAFAFSLVGEEDGEWGRALQPPSAPLPKVDFIMSTS